MTGKRLIPVAGLLAGLCVVLGGSAAAGGGGWGAPGKYTYNDSSAYTFLSDESQANYAWVMVDRGLLTFKMKRTPGAPVVQEYGTVLQVSLQSNSAGSYEWGCWVIPDSAFTMAKNLSTARVNVQATPDQVCPGYFVGATAGARPGLQGPVADGGGGGGWGGTLSSVTVDVSWTSNGGVWQSQTTQNSHCQTYSTSGQGSDSYAFSTASGTVSPIDGTLTDPYAQLVQASFGGNASGTLSSACGGWGA